MATLKFSLLIFFFSFLYASSVAAAATTTTTEVIANKDYLKAECAKVPFHEVCHRTMRSHAGNIGHDGKNLTKVGLQIARNWTLKAETYVIGFSNMHDLKHIDYNALKSCWQMLNSSVGNLNSSLSHLENLGARGALGFRQNATALTTMINYALSNVESCKDEMADTNLHNDVRVSIKARMGSVSMLLCNSMAFASSFVHAT